MLRGRVVESNTKINKMKDTELKKGNLVDTGRGIASIHCFVYKEVRVSLSPTGKQPRRFGFLISELKPIPLTEEWFKDFGFERNGFHFDLDFIQIIYEKNNDFRLEYKCSGIRFNNFYYSRQILYVHQLQNLYFALTGKELIIKA